jgi:YegS/Rv2252/BmrU family lipid kinase
LKLLIVFNPNAQSGRSGRKLPSIRAAFVSHSIEADFVMTRECGHATQLVAETALDPYDGVVAVGGDGTVFEVLNGLYAHRRSNRPALGLIPMGTGNAFAREFGLVPDHWMDAVRLIASGRTRWIDVGQADCAGDQFYFLNILGMGFAVDAGLAAKRLKFVGNPAYTLGTLWRTLKLDSYPLVIECDGQRIEQDNVFVEVSNSRYTGTTFLIAPAAEIDDGLLDVTLLRRLSRLRLLRLFPTIYKGRHIEFDEVETYRARRIRILAPEGMMLAPDGEFRGQSPVDIKCLHKDLALFC